MEFEGRETIHKIQKIAQGITPSGFIEYKKIDFPTINLYWRCFSNFCAILVLLDENYAEEAFSLSRSLFTDSMRLMQISELGDNRASLTLGWINDSFKQMKGLFYKAKELGIDPDPSEAIEHINAQQTKLQAYMKRIGVEKLQKFRPEVDAAIRYGRKEDYWFFYLSHEMVHGTDTSFIFRREKIANDTFGLYAQSRDLEFLIRVSTFAGKSMLDAIESVVNILSWDLTEDIDKLRSKLNDIQSRDFNEKIN